MRVSAARTAGLALAAAFALGCVVPPPPAVAPPEPPAPAPAPAPPPTLLGAPPVLSGVVRIVDTRGAVASLPALRRALATHAGDPYDPGRVQADLRALWALRLFDDVAVEAADQPSGVALTYVVVERPMIERTAFAGVSKVPVDELGALVAALRGAPADPAAIDAARRLVHDRFREIGHRLARVETEQSRVAEGKVEVRFVVDEGPRVVLGRWAFTGNTRVKEAVLRAQMEGGVHNAAGGVHSAAGGVAGAVGGVYNAAGGVYSEDRWERDALRITAYYFDHGMLAAQVGPAEVTASADGTSLAVEVPIVEGPVFHIGKIEIADPAAGKAAARAAAALRLKRGEVFNRTRVKEDLDRLRAWFAREQHRKVALSPVTELDMTAGRVDLVLRVEDAP